MPKSSQKKMNKFTLQRNEDGSKLLKCKIKGDWKSKDLSSIKKYLDRCGLTFLEPPKQTTDDKKQDDEKKQG